MHPTIKFKIDPSMDWESLRGFVNDSKYDGGRGLEWAIYSKHPNLKGMVRRGLSDDAEKEIKKYINEFYVSHESEIVANLEVYASAWKQKEKEFFLLVEDVFGDVSWPPGLYEAYATMWGMFPRSLDDKTFQVPAIYENKPYVNVIVAHELLHFMFYEYFYAKYPEHNKEDDNFLAWNVSEIFNSMIQNSKPWLDVFSLRSMTYPEHEEIEENLRSKFPAVNKQNIAELTQEILNISKKIS